MEIVSAWPFPAERMLATDRDGYEHHVIVVKATFELPKGGGEPRLAADQIPLHYADVYHGDPAATSVRYPYDFAPEKPAADILLLGSAHAPEGRPVRSLFASLQLEGRITKVIRVVGDRIWETGGVTGLVASEPLPFLAMPLRYERAFGGVDDSSNDPAQHVHHRQNLVGVGLYGFLRRERAAGRSLPNLEHPDHPMQRAGDRTPTAGFAPLCPGWLPRISYAGTYDKAWLDDRFPLVPRDFDSHFFQAAPVDQRVPHLSGGELVQLVNVTPEGRVSFTVPRIPLPITLIYDDRREEEHVPVLDTLLIDTDLRKVCLTWRLRVPRRGKPYALRCAVIGEMSARWWRRRRAFKRYYSSLSALFVGEAER